MRWVVCNRCKKKLPHHAKGLCVDCYGILHPGNRKEGYCKNEYCPRVQPTTIWARGLCSSCYGQWHRQRERGVIGEHATTPQSPIRLG